jgi:hypothetical protein
MPKLEKDLEERCRTLAKANDGKLLKFAPPQKGWHDRLLMLPGFICLVEFKRSQKAAVQALQDLRQAWCDARHIPAYRVWDYDQFVEIVRKNAGMRAGNIVYRRRNWP